MDMYKFEIKIIILLKIKLNYNLAMYDPSIHIIFIKLNYICIKSQ